MQKFDFISSCFIMNKSLVIAEKPSVASDIAKALGGFKKQKDVFEHDDMVITSAGSFIEKWCRKNMI